MKIDIGEKCTETAFFGMQNIVVVLRDGRGAARRLRRCASHRPTFRRKLSNFPMSRIINLSETRTLSFLSPQTHVRGAAVLVAPLPLRSVRFVRSRPQFC